MFSRFTYTVFLGLTFQVWQIVCNDVYSYKLSQMYADMFAELNSGYLRETEGLVSILQGYSELSKALSVYQQALTKAQGTSCDTTDSATKVQAYKDALEVSRKDCQNLPICATDLGQNTQWILRSVHAVDEDTSKDASACEDLQCKRNAYDNLRTNLAELYEDFMPGMHLGANVNLGEPQCSSEILWCFNNKNANNVQQIQEEISQLEACTANN